MRLRGWIDDWVEVGFEAKREGDAPPIRSELARILDWIMTKFHVSGSPW